jgi:hypothetical protein
MAAFLAPDVSDFSPFLKMPHRLVAKRFNNPIPLKRSLYAPITFENNSNRKYLKLNDLWIILT